MIWQKGEDYNQLVRGLPRRCVRQLQEMAALVSFSWQKIDFLWAVLHLTKTIEFTLWAFLHLAKKYKTQLLRTCTVTSPQSERTWLNKLAKDLITSFCLADLKMLLRCDILTYLSHLLLVLNSSMNIVIYCWKVVSKAKSIRMAKYFSSGWKVPERPAAPFNISRHGSKVAQQFLRPHKSPPPHSNRGETWRENWKGRRLAAGFGVPDWSPSHRDHHNMSQALLWL